MDFPSYYFRFLGYLPRIYRVTMVVLDLKFDFYFGNVHGWWVVNPFKGEFVKNCPKEGRKGGCVNLSVTDPENLS